jgi:hypothetical protein
VWGREDALERAAALIGGRLEEGGVREGEGKIFAGFVPGITEPSIHMRQQGTITLLQVAKMRER